MGSFTLKISPGIYVTVRRVCYFIYYIFLFVLKLFGSEMSLRIDTNESPVSDHRLPPVSRDLGESNSGDDLYMLNIIIYISLLILYIYLYTYLSHTIRIQTSDIGCRLLSQYIDIYICTRDIIKNTYIFI